MIEKDNANKTLLFSAVLTLIFLIMYYSGLTHVFDERDASPVKASIQIESDFIEIKAEAECWSCDLCIAGY